MTKSNFLGGGLLIFLVSKNRLKSEKKNKTAHLCLQKKKFKLDISRCYLGSQRQEIVIESGRSKFI